MDVSTVRHFYNCALKTLVGTSLENNNISLYDFCKKLLNKEDDIDDVDDVDEPHRTPTHRIQMNELREGIYANKQRILSVSTELE